MVLRIMSRGDAVARRSSVLVRTVADRLRTMRLAAVPCVCQSRPACRPGSRASTSRAFSKPIPQSPRLPPNGSKQA